MTPIISLARNTLYVLPWDDAGSTKAFFLPAEVRADETRTFNIHIFQWSNGLWCFGVHEIIEDGEEMEIAHGGDLPSEESARGVVLAKLQQLVTPKEPPC